MADATAEIEPVAPAALTPAPAPPRDADTPDPDRAVFSQQMCEVQLLLDFVSGSTGRRLPDAAAAEAAGLPADWIEQIFRISWPPAGTPAAQAEEEALLVKVKDYLNALATPANGVSVAFTLLVAQEDNDTAPPGPVEHGSPAGQSFSRDGLVRVAFPGLIVKARGFRTGMNWIRIVLIGWLVLTCGLSWYAAMGNNRLAQLATAEAALAAVSAKIAAPVVVPVTPVETVAETPPADDAVASAPASAPAATAEPAAPATVAILPAAATVSDPVSCTTVRPGTAPAPICLALTGAQADVEAAKRSVGSWLPFYKPQVASAATVYRTISWLSVLGTGVLPVFYGFLGAAAAVMRVLSQRMRQSLLLPRDLTLALQQLALGAVVGACIGLFVSTDGSSSVLGTVSLSSSALSFIAGFGVEAVFATLESVIARVFNVAPPPQPADKAAAGS